MSRTINVSRDMKRGGFAPRSVIKPSQGDEIRLSVMYQEWLEDAAALCGQSVPYYDSRTVEQVVLQLCCKILLEMMLMSGDCLVPVLLQIAILIQLTSTAALTNIIKMAVHSSTR